MIAVGITGGIASGKTTVAKMFADAGVPVFDADAAVHALYADPPKEIAEAFSAALVDGKIDRRRLAALIGADPSRLDELESLTHPIVRRRIEDFLFDAEEADRPLVALEVPLLFETGADALCDRILVTTVPAETAAERLRQRGMSPDLARELTERQMPLDAKIDRADYVVDSGASMDAVRRIVGDIIAELTAAARD